MMQLSAQSLITIINDVLDFTKLEAGKMKLESIPFEPRLVIDSCLGAAQAQLEKKGLPVTLSSDVGNSIPVKLTGDPNRFRQILSNMLTNAVKFTSMGKIQIAAKRQTDDTSGRTVVKFSIKDSGIGMTDKQQAIIFDPYQQADSTVSRNYGGTGLGLSICKSLVESMGGRIGVRSKEGVGSTFWFELPFERYIKPASIGVQSKKRCTGDNIDLRSIKKLNVLVAEDDKVNQKVVLRMLQRLGHTVVIAQNGKEALDAVIRTKSDSKVEAFDVVLMDWQMPVLDGIDATKEIRCQGFPMADLPIIGLTASIQSMDWRQVGMNKCLKKPVRINELKQCLDAMQVSSQDGEG